MAAAVSDSYGVFYGGAFREPKSAQFERDVSAATQEPLCDVAVSGESDVAAAVESACDAFASWRRSSSRERADLLLSLADVLAANAEELAIIETMDTGRPIAETEIDMDDGIDLLRYFAGVVRSREGALVDHSSTDFSMVIREPYGVVGAIVPWNFPLLIALWKLAPALAAGNAVVIKPASLTPLSLLRLAEMTREAIPPGLLNIVPGSGAVTGAALVNHPDVSKLSFTGSTGTGRGVAAAAAARTVPVTLELGGKSANVVFPDADLSRAVEGSAMAIMYSSGQVCNAGSRLLLHEDVQEEFLERYVALLDAIVVGNPLDRDTRLGPLVGEQHYSTVAGYIDTGVAEGATLLCGGKRKSGGVFDAGYYLEPTVFTNTRPEMRIVREEIFGPVLVVQVFRTEEEAIELANDSEFGLAGGLWTADINRAIRVARAVDAGTVWVNEFNVVPAGSPFGGFKKSGYGREVHRTALESYSQVKNIYVGTSEGPYGWY